MKNDEVLKIFVGTDRSQLLAVKVLKHSIERHTKFRSVVKPLMNLKYPKPKNPQNWQRTGFSFARFCIPNLCNFKGMALYLDADMLVFDDISEIWSLKAPNKTIYIQKEIKHAKDSLAKIGAPKKRIKQCSVMLIDCDKAKWNIKKIIKAMDNQEYDYDKLMYEMCIVPEKEVSYSLPFEWNSLEHFDLKTKLIHYTDMHTQPWVSPFNRNAYLWFDEISLMLKNKKLTITEIQKEIALGYFRPSLILDIRFYKYIPKILFPLWASVLGCYDNFLRFKKHKDVYRDKKIRMAAIKKFNV